MPKIRMILSAGVAAAAIAGSGTALATSSHSTNYRNCVAQKKAVAEHYCNKSGSDCKAQMAAARRECRGEVREGLKFKKSGDDDS